MHGERNTKNYHRHHGRMMGLKDTIPSGILSRQEPISAPVSRTVLRAVSGYSRDGACFKLDNKHGGEKLQWFTEDDFSKSTH